MCDSLYKHYSKQLACGQEGVSLESNEIPDADLSAPAIKERIKFTKAFWKQLIRQSGDDPSHYDIIEDIYRGGYDVLSKVRDRETIGDADRNLLEAIVRTDGSRPSFLVKDGAVDFQSSPAGAWYTDLVTSESFLKNIFNKIGRIDNPALAAGYAGTGFLVGKNHVLTNRHVLQQVATQSGTTWNIQQDVTINFAHELNGQLSSTPRKLKKIIFAGPDTISTTGRIDHTKLDLALIEIEDDPADDAIGFQIRKNFQAATQKIYIIGYPARPRPGIDPKTLLDELFNNTFGYERIAPGMLINGQVSEPWTLSHDATTLGGNSGSVVVEVSSEFSALALHYGGTSLPPRENWAHQLEKTFTTVDPLTGKTLEQCLHDAEVIIT